MYAVTQILFPPKVIPQLTEVGGTEWKHLVARVAALEETHPESLAFSLMMIRLNGCLECETDSFRALRGCAACALQTIRRFKGGDKELLNLYQAALKDISAYLTQPQAVERHWGLQPA